MSRSCLTCSHFGFVGNHKIAVRLICLDRIFEDSIWYAESDNLECRLLIQQAVTCPRYEFQERTSNEDSFFEHMMKVL